MEISLNEFTRFAVANSNNKVQTLTHIKSSQNSVYAPEKDYYKYLREGVINYEDGSLSLADFQVLNIGLSDSRKTTGYQAPLNGYTTWRGQFSGQGLSVVKKRWSNGSLVVKVNPTICIEDGGLKNHIIVNFKKEPFSQDRVNVMTTVMNEVYNNNSDRSYILNVRDQNLLTVTPSATHSLRVVMEAAALQAIWPQV